eukprot:SAG31_NODE_973_length_10632_cov_7.175622_6_plen_77_part_00
MAEPAELVLKYFIENTNIKHTQFSERGYTVKRTMRASPDGLAPLVAIACGANFKNILGSGNLESVVGSRGKMVPPK